MNTTLKKPSEVFNGDNLPDDLKWLMSDFGLPKNDPTIVLLAWHWQRVQNHNDTIQNSILMLKAALDARVEVIQGSAQAISGIIASLDALLLALSEKPLQVSRQIETELKVPMSSCVDLCSALVDRLQSLLNRTDTTLEMANRRQKWACFISGLVIGSMLIPWTYSLCF